MDDKRMRGSLQADLGSYGRAAARVFLTGSSGTCGLGPEFGDRVGDADCFAGSRPVCEDRSEKTPALVLPWLEVECRLHSVTLG
jgi:hypothetical protein